MRRWGVRISIGVSVAAACLSMRWAWLAAVGPDTHAIRLVLSTLIARRADLEEATSAAVTHIRRENTVAAFVAAIVAIGAAVVWLPEALRNRDSVASRPTALWALALAVPAALAVFHVSLQVSQALT